jgi:hypothetical protein
MNLGTLLSKGIKWFSTRRVQARARLLFDLYEKVLQIKNYGNLINSVFKVDVSRLSREALIVENIGRKVDQLTGVDRRSEWNQNLLLKP